MDIFFKFIESVGGLLTSLLAVIVFFKMVVFPFFIKLKVQLTKDLFFRLTDLGEVFFPKIIVYSPINIQITKCSFELKSQEKNTQETSYNCKAEKFGSVKRNTINGFSFPFFYLPKSSPEFLLKPGESKELLIQCSITGSKQNIIKAIKELYINYTQSGNFHSRSNDERASQQ